MNGDFRCVLVDGDRFGERTLEVPAEAVCLRSTDDETADETSQRVRRVDIGTAGGSTLALAVLEVLSIDRVCAVSRLYCCIDADGLREVSQAAVLRMIWNSDFPNNIHASGVE